MLAVHRAMQTWTRMVDIYIALTEFAREKFIEGGLPDNRICVKPHFVHPDPGVGDGRGGYLLLVSRLSHEKGIDTVLEAWRRLGGRVPLKIVGDGPLAEFVVESIRQLPGVQWLGRKGLPEVYELMREATGVLFPSRWYETFGRVIIEAYAGGTPVIGSRIGVIPELITENETGLLFEPGNAPDLAEKVEQLLASPNHLARMRHNVRERFLSRYTAEQNYQMLRTIYEAAINWRD
jgi:glycosyltransferase involved in cell wall biosynthesis